MRGSPGARTFKLRAWAAAILVAPSSWALSGCGGSTAQTGPGPVQPSGVYLAPAGGDTSPTAVESEQDAPEISRSAGRPGSVVVLWPRIVLTREAGAPDVETRALARKAQARLAELVRQARPSLEVDVRPEPERVCPRQGCRVPAVGLLLERVGDGCALVATVSQAGASSATLIPWVGVITLDATTTPFREPPERVVHVKDLTPCGGALSAPAADDDAVLRALTR